MSGDDSPESGKQEAIAEAEVPEEVEMLLGSLIGSLTDAVSEGPRLRSGNRTVSAFLTCSKPGLPGSVDYLKSCLQHSSFCTF